MSFPTIGFEGWKAQVEKDLAGASFEKTLVTTTPEGIALQPLYVTAPVVDAGIEGNAPFQVCMAHERFDGEALDEDVHGGAEALWLRSHALSELAPVFARVNAAKVRLVLEAGTEVLGGFLGMAAAHGVTEDLVRLTLGADPVRALAEGVLSAEGLTEALRDLGKAGATLDARCPQSSAVMVSTLGHHAAGANAAEEIGAALSTGVVYLQALLDAGLSVDTAARQIAVQVAVGRDTFGELAKLRALRLVWRKMLAAAGASEPQLATLHAVSAWRTLTQRDPWVNLLRVSTQAFAAILGGADLVTPAHYDDALGGHGSLGRRVARNTCLVLREESHLGRVVDPAAGSYYLDSLTDELARKGWAQFQALERSGGMVTAIASGAFLAQLQAGWKARSESIAKRKEAITGVSEFANLQEPAVTAKHDEPVGRWPVHRDAEGFERLREGVEAGGAPTVTLVTLGAASEFRARVGFCQGFFAAGGLKTTVSSDDPSEGVAVLCGADERYATEAVERVKGLRAKGVRVFLAGRPGALEGALREAGVEGFVFLGSDVVATLSTMVGGGR